jgi:ketosteroid isomerase-like protein
MTTRLALFLLAICLTFSLSVSADDVVNAAIVGVVDEAYVQGIHLDGDAAKVRNGMHESFVMLVRTETGVNRVTRDEWIARLKPRDPSAPRPDVKAEIKVLDQAGDAAVVRVHLFRDGKQIFTDYIALYRFADGWKLVGKTFQRM